MGLTSSTVVNENLIMKPSTNLRSSMETTDPNYTERNTIKTVKTVKTKESKITSENYTKSSLAQS